MAPCAQLIYDYLFSHKQKIQVGDERSEFRFVGNGVPQESTLSTLLFLFYVNDLFKLHLTGYLQLFADDAVLMYSYTGALELSEQIKHDLDLLYRWFYNNHSNPAFTVEITV